MEIGSRLYALLEPGIGALSPVQLNSYVEMPISVDHDSHVKVYKQDLRLEKAWATFDTAMQMTLTNANAAMVDSFRRRAFSSLVREQAKANNTTAQPTAR